MFLAEARAAASLVHPHIVAVHNLGEVEGRHFIEMEYVPGESLQRLVTTQTRLLPLEATRYMVQSCSALAAAHQQGLVHRDFKPANILVRHDGIAKLADFGLARPVMADAAASEGGLAGTPYFMAPELFQGRPGSMAGDVYAAGISFYYLLTGQFPFTGKHLMQIGQLHAQQPIPDPRELVPVIPGAAVEILRRALAKQPEERYPSGRELHLELQNLFTTLKDLPSLVSEAIQQLDASSRQQDRRIAIVVRMPRGRTQTVFVEEIAADPWPTALVRIYSICGPAEPSYFRRALELNASVPHGAGHRTNRRRPPFRHAPLLPAHHLRRRHDQPQCARHRPLGR